VLKLRTPFLRHKGALNTKATKWPISLEYLNLIALAVAAQKSLCS
jgi:hypothetical protein